MKITLSKDLFVPPGSRYGFFHHRTVWHYHILVEMALGHLRAKLISRIVHSLDPL